MQLAQSRSFQVAVWVTTPVVCFAAGMCRRPTLPPVVQTGLFVLRFRPPMPSAVCARVAARVWPLAVDDVEPSAESGLC